MAASATAHLRANVPTVEWNPQEHITPSVDPFGNPYFKDKNSPVSEVQDVIREKYGFETPTRVPKDSINKGGE